MISKINRPCWLKWKLSDSHGSFKHATKSGLGDCCFFKPRKALTRKTYQFQSPHKQQSEPFLVRIELCFCKPNPSIVGPFSRWTWLDADVSVLEKIMTCVSWGAGMQKSWWQRQRKQAMWDRCKVHIDRYRKRNGTTSDTSATTNTSTLHQRFLRLLVVDISIESKDVKRVISCNGHSRTDTRQKRKQKKLNQTEQRERHWRKLTLFASKSIRLHNNLSRLPIPEYHEASTSSTKQRLGNPAPGRSLTFLYHLSLTLLSKTMCLSQVPKRMSEISFPKLLFRQARDSPSPTTVMNRSLGMWSKSMALERFLWK